MNKRFLLTFAFGLVGLFAGLILTSGPVGVSLLTAAGVGMGLLIPIGGQAQLGFIDYGWRMIPANPILLRVVESGGKRKRDLFIRCGYLGLLVLVVVVSLLSSNSTGSGNATSGGLDALAQTSGQIFERMSYLQLGLVALLAPIFTAGAITQEKDSQTYDILLATPLSNAQILLGSLLSRLFFVIALLLSGIPIFSITQIFGGVSIASIVKSFGIAAATAFVTGCLAMAIAVFKVGTRRTIFSFYLFVVIYLVGLFLLDQVPFFQIAGHERNANSPSHISWFTGLHPFLALRVIFHDPSYTPPLLDELPASLNYWPMRWYLTNPAGFFISFMFFLSFVLVSPSILVLRRIAQSTNSLKNTILQKLKISTGDRTQKPRIVWTNPIAWREAKTKASAARASVLRYGFIGAGVLGAIFLAIRFSSVLEPDFHTNDAAYNRQAGTLVVYGPGGTTATYRIARDSVVERERFDPSEENNPTSKGWKSDGTISLEALHGRMEVSKITPPFPAPSTGIPISFPNAATGKTSERVLQSMTLRPMPRAMEASTVRTYLLGATIVEFAVILLIVTNAAASTVTREKEDGTLDILLATPITSRYYIWGKLRGLVSFVLPLVAVPVVSVLIFVICDIFRRMGDWDDPSFQWIVFPESVLILPGTLIIVASFSAILGMQMSLRCRTTVMAVMSSVGIVVGACAGLGFCGYSFVSNGSSNMGSISMVPAAFSPFTLLTILINPYSVARPIFGDNVGSSDTSEARIGLFIGAWVAVGLYTLIVLSMYKSMVKNFDMTIRKQSR